MYIEIGVPATLPLALVKLQENGHERLCLLAATLAHPPIHIRAQVADSITITGPRADVAVAYAQHLYDLTKPTTLTEIEIEYAIPVAMGHGSETMLGLGIAHAIKHFNTPQETDVVTLTNQLGDEGMHSSHGTNGLSLWAGQDGGLLLLDLENETAPPLRRAEPDSTEKNAWGLVSILPRLDGNLDEDVVNTLEADRYARLIDAAKILDPSSGAIFTQSLWPAVEADNIEAFGSELAKLQQLTTEAMQAVGISSLVDDKQQAVLQQMQESGAAACGQSLTGYGLYAFARGARATINMRLALKEVVDYSDGVMDATFIDSKGIQVVEKDGSMVPVGTLLDRL